MAAVGSTVLTLADWAKRLDPNGKTAVVAELLNQTNAILDDALFKEGNLPTGERVTLRTGLPSVYFRLLNQGVPSSKSRTAQVDEQCAILEARSEIDVDIVKLNGNTSEFRMSEAEPFIEAMNQTMATTMFYGTSANPEEFVGLSARYAATTDGNGQNIILGGGAGADNTSVWLVGWGQNAIYGAFPKGSRAGLLHEDLGIADAFDASNNRFRAYMDRWQWKAGLVVKDWRFGVRIPNVDVSDSIALANSQAVGAATFLPKLMARSIDRLPNLGTVKPVFYCNRTILSNLRVMAMEKTINVLNIENGLTQFGAETQTGLTFLGIPVRPVDALLNTEALVA